MKKVNGKMLAVDIAECAIFAALMVAGAYISIPVPPPLVPLTFQTVIAVLAGLLLGAKKGVISMAIYCFMGLIGIPEFSAAILSALYSARSRPALSPAEKVCRSGAISSARSPLFSSITRWAYRTASSRLT